MASEKGCLCGTQNCAGTMEGWGKGLWNRYTIMSPRQRMVGLH